MIPGHGFVSDIFQEVQEDLRTAQLKSLWERYGILVIGGAVALVLGTALAGYWRDKADSESEAAAMKYLAAEQLSVEGKPADAVAQFSKLAQETDIEGYALMARMKEAATRLETGDRTGAIAAYDALAADSGLDPLLRDVSSLKAALLLFDTASADELKLRLMPLAKEDSPVRHSAKEALAFIAMRENSLDAARAQFQELADALDAPRGVRARAAEILDSLPAAPKAAAASDPVKK